MHQSSWLDPKEVQPLDLLLHLGKSQISALVAWFGDAIYSHIAIMVEAGNFVEAAPGGARALPLARRIAQANDYLVIDVYRPCARGGRVPSAPQIAAVVQRAHHYLGSPYPFDLLAQLGVISALRGRLPENNVIRWVIRLAIDAALARDPAQVMCSEIVFRALAEAPTRPEDQMRPAIVVSAPLLLPFPAIDVAQLRKELEAMLKPFPPMAQLDLGQQPVLDASHSDAALAGDYAKLRTLYGRSDQAVRASDIAASDVIVVPDPNPKTVSPGDLERSPSVRFVGRLRLG